MHLKRILEILELIWNFFNQISMRSKPSTSKMQKFGSTSKLSLKYPNIETRQNAYYSPKHSNREGSK